MSYKPATYNSVSPYLIVQSVEATLSFLKQVFLNSEELRCIPNPSGGLMHAEIRIDDSVIMLADAVPPEIQAQTAHVHIYVEDVDACYQRALQAGAESLQAPVQKDDPDKRGGVRGPSGINWWISTQQNTA